MATFTLLTLPVAAFLGFWYVDRVREYYMGTAESALAGFVAAAMPADVHASIVDGFDACCIKPSFAERLTLIRTHVGLGAALGILFMLQLHPAVRTKAYGLHKVLGAVCFPLVVSLEAHLAYVFFFGSVDVGVAVWLFELMQFIVLGVCYPLAVQAIMVHKDVVRHRQLMLMCAAAIFSNPVQRVWMGTIAKTHLPHGPYTDFRTWLNEPVAISCVVAVANVYGVALYFARQAPLARDVAHVKAVVMAAAESGGSKAEKKVA